jgi:hypothetical protein
MVSASQRELAGMVSAVRRRGVRRRETRDAVCRVARGGGQRIGAPRSVNW